MRTLLKGYYGWGNFGDDVLFKVTSYLVAKLLENPEQFVSPVGPDGSYLKNLVDAPVRIGDASGNAFDTIVHGGGGTFFDFGDYGIGRRLLGTAILAMGPGFYSGLAGAVGRSGNRPKESAKARLGWGIGVGTYAPGSSKLLRDWPILGSFSALMVRDTQSADNLNALRIDIPVVVGSDLAFVYEGWLGGSPDWGAADLQKSHRKRVGLILRTWPYAVQKDYHQALLELLDALEKWFEVDVFLFEERHDRPMKALLSNRRVIVWHPERNNMAEFCRLIAKQACLITTRAHGAICGAVLGTPAVVVAIEPKMTSVHRMLPKSTRLVGLSELKERSLMRLLDELMAVKGSEIRNEVEANRSAAVQGVGATLAGLATDQA